MTSLYEQQMANAGPLAAPQIQRSQVLADALRALQASGDHISSLGGLGTRLLAQALLQYGQHRQDRRVRDTMQEDARNNPLAQLFAPSAATSPTSPDTAVGMGSGTTPTGAGSPAPSALAAPPPAPGAALGAALQPPVDALANHNAKTADLAARLLAREGPAGAGQVAVGNVVRNRGSTGMDLGDVMTQPNQFEPLNDRNRAAAMAMSTTDPRYQAGMQAWQQSATQQAAPPGSMNFYSPEAQRRLAGDGRQLVPDFARGGGGTNIGGNEFFQGQFSPPQGYQNTPPVPTPQAAPPETQPTPAQPPPSAGAPPAAPAPSGPAGGQPQIPQVRGMESVPPQQRAYIYSLMTSGNPQQMAMGQQMAQHAIAEAMSPPGYRAQPNFDQGYVVYMPDDPNTGRPFTVPIPGWHRDPGQGFEYGPDGRARPIPGRETTQVAAGSPGAPPAAPGTTFNRDATGNMSLINAGFPQGYMPSDGPAPSSTGTAGATWQPGQPQPPKGALPRAQQQPQPAGMAPVPGGQYDITAPAQRIPALVAERDRLRPILAQANLVFQNINAVREGVRAQNGPGDLAIANGFQQLLNAGMVTGEEIRAQASSLGLGGDISRVIQYVQGGGNLNPQSRAAFGRLAEQLYIPRLNQLRDQTLSLRPLLDQYGPGSFDLVVPPDLRRSMGWEAAPHPRPEPHAPPHPGAQPRRVLHFNAQTGRIE